jgi:hypothetical protein
MPVSHTSVILYFIDETCYVLRLLRFLTFVRYLGMTMIRLPWPVRVDISWYEISRNAMLCLLREIER